MAYIPYNNEEIDLEELNSLADSKMNSYLDSRVWAKNLNKRNEWIKAYNDVKSRGVTGINGNIISHNGLNFDGNEYYNDVAYFFLKVAPKVKTRKSIEEEAKKKEEERIAALPEYNFNLDFKNYIINSEYGGNRENFSNDLINWDKADKYGIRGNDNRKKHLLDFLKNYKNLLKYENYRFTGEIFPNKEDLENKLNRAISALENQDPNDDDDYLNKLGLDKKLFLDTGENDMINYGGVQMTASLARELDLKAMEEERNIIEKNRRNEEAKKKQEEDKKKQEELAKLKLKLLLLRQKINQYKTIYTYIPNTESTYNEYNVYNLYSNLDEMVDTMKHTYANISSEPDFRKKGHRALLEYRIAHRNGKLKDISNETYQILSRSKHFREGITGGRPKQYYKQLEGIDNIIYDTIGDKIYYLDLNKIPDEKDPIRKYHKRKEEEAVRRMEEDRRTRYPFVIKQGGTINFNYSIDKIVENFIKEYNETNF